MSTRGTILKERFVSLREILAQAVQDAEVSEDSYYPPNEANTGAPPFPIIENFVQRYNYNVESSTMNNQYQDKFEHSPTSLKDSNFLLTRKDSAATTFDFDTERTVPLRSMLFERNTDNIASMTSKLLSPPIGYGKINLSRQVSLNKCEQPRIESVQPRISIPEVTPTCTATPIIVRNNFENPYPELPYIGTGESSTVAGNSIFVEQKEGSNSSKGCEMETSHEDFNNINKENIHMLLEPGNGCINNESNDVWEERDLLDDTASFCKDAIFPDESTNIPESLYYLPTEMTTAAVDLARNKQSIKMIISTKKPLTKGHQDGKEDFIYHDVVEDDYERLLSSDDDTGSIQPDPQELQQLQEDLLHTQTVNDRKVIDSTGSTKDKDDVIPTFDEIECDFSPDLSLYRLQQLMTRSRKTQEMLQNWDEMNGLPRSHSVTMMHTNRSRQQLEQGRILPKWNGKPLIKSDNNKGDKNKKRQRAKKLKICQDTTTTSVRIDHPNKKAKTIVVDAGGTMRPTGVI